jgi:hypothetical protein
MAPTPYTFPPDVDPRNPEDIPATKQLRLLQRKTAHALFVWFCVMLAGFGFFVLLRVV